VNENNQGNQNNSKRQYLNYYIKVVSVFVGLFVLLKLSLTVDIYFNNVTNGSLQIYYSNSNESINSLMEYYTAWKPIDTTSTHLKFEEVPLLTDTLRMDIDGTKHIEIREVTISLGGMCLKRYNAETLYTSIKSQEHLKIEPSEKVLFCETTGNDAFIELNSCRYLNAAYMAIIIILLLGISMMINQFIARCNERWINEYNEQILLISIPIAMYILTEYFNYDYWYVDIKYRLINCAILIALYRIVYICMAKSSIAILICNFAYVIYGMINYYLIIFRGKPLLPTDIYAIRTAMDVAGGYTFPITLLEMVDVLAAVGLWYIFKKVLVKRKKWIKSVIANLICAGLIISFVFTSTTYKNMNTSFWESDILYFCKMYGMIAYYTKYQEKMHVSKPKSYAEITQNDFIDKIPRSVNQPDLNGVKPTNIIMIMNESYSDLKVFKNDFGSNITPVYDSLKKNTVKGNLYVSVRGGGTCNTEFESLTGNSLIFFPPGTTPYQTYIHKNINSIASYLQEMGYSVYGMHLASPLNWNRKNVYPLLGFPQLYSENDFDDIETIRNLATDDENYRRIIDFYENKETEKFFCYDVTIQNHGGYNRKDDLETTVDLAEYGYYSDAEIFLSLIQKSDEALGKLISYFEQVEEPTMIILYGDHQPTLSNETESWLFSEQDPDSSKLNRYITPFLIWTNYNTEEEYVDKISANYLSSFIMEKANMPMPIFNQFLMYMYEKYPVLTTQGIIDSNNNFYRDYQEITDGGSDFSLYEKIQYNGIFDKNIEQSIFTVK